MAEMNRYLIGSVKRSQTKAGKPTAELYAADGRLQFPVLILFDLSMLETIGIDPNELGTEPIFKRCWAFYVESDKETSRGSKYKDVQFLERLDSPATTTSTDNSAVLAELRAIRELLQFWIKHNTLPMEQVDARQQKPVSILYGDGTAVSDNAAEREAFAAFIKIEAIPPRDLPMLRNWYAKQNGN